MFSSAFILIDRSLASPRSSMSSDHGIFANRPQTHSNAPVTPGRDLAADRSGLNGTGVSTDPTIIHAITQTMIGEFLYKYTRRTIGKGHGDRRHKRFFWVHPYTKTLYWSSADPGSSNVSESSAKSGMLHIRSAASITSAHTSVKLTSKVSGLFSILTPCHQAYTSTVLLSLLRRER